MDTKLGYQWTLARVPFDDGSNVCYHPRGLCYCLAVPAVRSSQDQGC